MNQVTGLDALGDDDVWAVGWHLRGGGGEGGGPVYPLVLRWNGRAWRLVPVPQTPNASLSGVVAISRADAWAIGSIDEGNEVPLAFHWDGVQWTRARLPYSGHRFAHLIGVAASGASDVWAVGNWATGHSGGTLAMHYDGARWRIVPTPSPAPRPLLGRPYPGLEAVSIARDGTIWSVGTRANVAPAAGANTLAMRYDRGAWTVVRTPDVADQSGRPAATLAAVTAQSPDVAWAVGSSGFNTGSENPEEPLVARWDGFAWRLQRIDPVAPDAVFTAVAATDAANAWAVGSARRAGTLVPLIERWDGRRWSQATAPSSPGSLSATTVSPAGTVWAGGATFASVGDEPPRTLIFEADCRRAG
jgi:hypothetical protein